LKAFNYGHMVLDEGHSIKNAKSARFQKLAAVGSAHRLLLSGTPVQNNLQEVSGSFAERSADGSFLLQSMI
jgi:DNA excision repair protein ERCC-6-like